MAVSNGKKSNGKKAPKKVQQRLLAVSRDELINQIVERFEEKEINKIFKDKAFTKVNVKEILNAVESVVAANMANGNTFQFAGKNVKRSVIAGRFYNSPIAETSTLLGPFVKMSFEIKSEPEKITGKTSSKGVFTSDDGEKIDVNSVLENDFSKEAFEESFKYEDAVTFDEAVELYMTSKRGSSKSSEEDEDEEEEENTSKKAPAKNSGKKVVKKVEEEPEDENEEEEEEKSSKGKKPVAKGKPVLKGKKKPEPEEEEEEKSDDDSEEEDEVNEDDSEEETDEEDAEENEEESDDDSEDENEEEEEEKSSKGKKPVVKPAPAKSGNNKKVVAIKPKKSDDDSEDENEEEEEEKSSKGKKPVVKPAQKPNIKKPGFRPPAKK